MNNPNSPNESISTRNHNTNGDPLEFTSNVSNTNQMTIDEIMDDARQEHARITLDAFHKIQDINVSVYQETCQTARDMQEAKVNAEMDLNEIHEEASSIRSQIQQDTASELIRLENDKQAYLARVSRQLESIESDLKFVEKGYSIETDEFVREQDERTYELSQITQKLQHQRESEQSLKAKEAQEANDALFAHQLQKAEDKTSRSEANARTTMKSAQELLQDTLREEEVKRQRIREAEQSKRGGSNYISCVKSVFSRLGNAVRSSGPASNTTSDAQPMPMMAHENLSNEVPLSADSPKNIGNHQARAPESAASEEPSCKPTRDKKINEINDLD